MELSEKSKSLSLRAQTRNPKMSVKHKYSKVLNNSY
jgi:hypothetical protein